MTCSRQAELRLCESGWREDRGDKVAEKHGLYQLSYGPVRVGAGGIRTRDNM